MSPSGAGGAGSETAAAGVGAAPTPRGRSLGRGLLVVSTAVAVGMTIWLAWRPSLETIDVSDVGTKVGVGLILETALEDMAKARSAGRRVVAFFGDSTVQAYPHGHRVHEALQRELNRGRRRRLRVAPLAFPGMSSFEYYALTPGVIESGADQVVLPVNLASFGRAWGTLFQRPQLAGWMPPSALPELALLPVHHWGATFDALLLYMGIVHAGGAERWDAFGHEQLRAHRQLDALRIRLGLTGTPKDGLPRRRVFRYRMLGADRPNAAGVRLTYGPALDGVDQDDPNLRMLAAALRRFEAAHVPVLVYVVPANVEHFEALGELDRDGLARTLDSIRSVVESAGQTCLDLHDLLPDAGFRDAGGHFTHDAGGIDGPRVVARAIAGQLRVPTDPRWPSVGMPD